MNAHSSLPSAESLYQVLLSQMRSHLESLPDAVRDRMGMVGIYTGGAWMAERLAQDLQLRHPAGFVNVSFHRDDYTARGLHPDSRPTRIPFSVEGAHIILVDDVLYTGRTIRAALNELYDFGRPQQVRLATLVDRGGRQLPIAPDFVAQHLSCAASETIHLQRAADGTLSLSISHV